MEETITASRRERKRRGRVHSFRSKGRRDGMEWERKEEDAVGKKGSGRSAAGGGERAAGRYWEE